MAASAPAILDELERARAVYGAGASERKRHLLAALDRRRLREPDEVARLHECLCWLRAYPDDDAVLALVETMLASFAERSDLRRNRRWLEQTGIAGTAIQYPFYWATARWLARRWPANLRVDWDWWNEAAQDRLRDEILPLLVPYSETPGLDMVDLPAKRWIERLRGPAEGDAAFVVRRFESLPGDDFTRESLYDSLDLAVVVEPGPDTPSRTRAKDPRRRIVFRDRPLDRGRPDLAREIARPPRSVRRVPPREADRLIDLTREAMVTRLRDLYSFAHADRNDVRIVDAGGGLEFVCMGAVPERRLMLEAVHGFLTLMNGVPIGYVLTGSLFGSTEIAYNVFETYRGGEAGRVFGRVVAMAAHLFGATAFSIDPYQLGHGNDEGLASGAWWFYAKLGFRPRDPEVSALARAERGELRRDPAHRSSRATLERLSAAPVFLETAPRGQPPLGALSLGNVGLRISAVLAERFGAARERGLDVCAAEAAERLGVRSTRSFTAAERLWWRRWSPLVAVLPGVDRWSAADRSALARVIRAKGGRDEFGYVRAFDRHRRLRRAILRLAEDL